MITTEENDRVIKLDNDILFVQYDLTEDVFSVRSGDNPNHLMRRKGDLQF